MSDQQASDASAAAGSAEPISITRDGFERLQYELTTLRDDRRPALVKQVERATLFIGPSAGTTVVNVARFDLDNLDQQIEHLETVLSRAQVIEAALDSSTVQVGSQVTVRYEDGTEEALTLVGPFEADPARGYVSSESPAGLALVGTSVGADVIVGSGDEAWAISVVGIGKPEATVNLLAGEAV